MYSLNRWTMSIETRSCDILLDDINGNRVDVNTIISFASVDAKLLGIDLKNERHITV